MEEKNIVVEKQEQLTASGEKVIIIREIEKAPVQENSANGMGIAGFVLALIGLFTGLSSYFLSLGVLFYNRGWIIFVGWLIWLLGLIFSIIGVTRPSRGLAIAGLVISVVTVVVVLIIYVVAGNSYNRYDYVDLEDLFDF